jgi:hypothetical protein
MLEPSLGVPLNHNILYRKLLPSRPQHDRFRDLDAWMEFYNQQRPHQGRWCYGKTPMHTFVDSVSLAKEKILAA